MLLNYLVKIPGEINVKVRPVYNHNSGMYVYYRRKTIENNGEVTYENKLIGKQCKYDKTFMQPNPNFYKYYPEETPKFSIEYSKYLYNHLQNVKIAYRILCEKLPVVKKWMEGYENLIEEHDISKYSDEEYPAYDAFFMKEEASNDDINAFNYAYLTHIHRNPHHWEYWLIFDGYKKSVSLIEIPLHYVVDMACDIYAAFVTSYGKFDYYDWVDSPCELNVNPNTRKILRQLLNALSDREVKDV